MQTEEQQGWWLLQNVGIRGVASPGQEGGGGGDRREGGRSAGCRCYFCSHSSAEHTVQDEMQQCSGSSVLFDEDLLCHVVAIHTISATRPTSSDITLVTMKMVVGLITMMTNVTFK